MAVSMAEITKLRNLTSAGLMDYCISIDYIDNGCDCRTIHKSLICT